MARIGFWLGIWLVGVLGCSEEGGLHAEGDLGAVDMKKGIYDVVSSYIWLDLLGMEVNIVLASHVDYT